VRERRGLGGKYQRTTIRTVSIGVLQPLFSQYRSVIQSCQPRCDSSKAYGARLTVFEIIKSQRWVRLEHLVMHCIPSAPCPQMVPVSSLTANYSDICLTVKRGNGLISVERSTEDE
jgi:hypothetical protein